MASISALNSPNIHSFHWKPISKNLILRPIFVSFPLRKARLCSIKANSDGVGPVSNGGADLLRKPVVSSPSDGEDDDESEKKGGGTWVDWEDQILQDTAPCWLCQNGSTLWKFEMLFGMKIMEMAWEMDRFKRALFRWFTYLNSDFKKGRWSPKENMLLCEFIGKDEKNGITELNSFSRIRKCTFELKVMQLS